MRHVQSTVCAIVLLLFSQACLTPSAQRGGLELTHVSISNQKARLITRTLADQFAGAIEVTSDRLAEQTNDLPTKRALLLWKLGGISAVFGASFHPDPYISFLDVVALAGQMRDFFVTGPGAEVLGPLSPQAAQACDRMWILANEVVDSIRGPLTGPRTFNRLDAWIKNHPVDNWQFDREPISPHIYLILGDDALTLGQTLATMQERLDDLSAQVTFINTKLLDRFRWQAELLLLDAKSDLPLDSLRLLLNTSNATLTNLDAFLESVPAVIRRERVAALRGIGQERSIALEALHAELDRLQAFVQGEREAALQQADNTAREAVTLAMTELSDIIDMLTLRLALLCLGFGILGGVIGGLVAFRRGKSPSSR